MYYITKLALTNKQPHTTVKTLSGSTQQRVGRIQNYEIEFTILGDPLDVQKYRSELSTGVHSIELGNQINPHELKVLTPKNSYPAGTQNVILLNPDQSELKDGVQYYVQFSGHRKLYTYKDGIVSPSLRYSVDASETITTKPRIYFVCTDDSYEINATKVEEVKFKGAESWE